LPTPPSPNTTNLYKVILPAILTGVFRNREYQGEPINDENSPGDDDDDDDDADWTERADDLQPRQSR
jgi:hypothetical protein